MVGGGMYFLLLGVPPSQFSNVLAFGEIVGFVLAGSLDCGGEFGF